MGRLNLLGRIGLEDHPVKYPDRLSGGQQQCVAIVRSLAMKGGVAPLGATTLIATHEMNFARDAAQQIVYLDHGVVVEQGTPEQMFTKPQHELTHQFLERFR